jgi:hypothetical protein
MSFLIAVHFLGKFPSLSQIMEIRETLFRKQDQQVLRGNKERQIVNKGTGVDRFVERVVVIGGSVSRIQPEAGY